MVERCEGQLVAFHDRVSGCFSRADAAQRALDYMRGLLSPLERKNGWTMAELAGRTAPDSMQHLLNRMVWDADRVRDRLRAYVLGHFSDPQAVLVADETGFLKKGVKSAGVQRQYSGTAGRIENCQVGVFLVYATAAGYTFVDRELFVPNESWIEQRARCREAGIPDEVGFATKPAQFRAMLERALEAGVPFAWSTADEEYGQNRGLRTWMQAEDVHYVMATKYNDVVEGCGGPATVKNLVALVPKHRWRRRSAGDGAHGKREYDWTRIEPPCDIPGRTQWVLARRSLSDGEIAYYLCFGPRETSLNTLVRVAGTRWRVQESFKTGKGECGLDHYQVRKYDAWYRHITLAMAAHAVLAVTRKCEHEREKGAADIEPAG